MSSPLSAPAPPGGSDLPWRIFALGYSAPAPGRLSQGGTQRARHFRQYTPGGAFGGRGFPQPAHSAGLAVATRLTCLAANLARQSPQICHFPVAPSALQIIQCVSTKPTPQDSILCVPAAMVDV